jgi:hypothetical protein
MLPLIVPGKPRFKIVELTEEYYDRLQIFCELCSTLGYVNNSSFKAMKLEQMKMPYGKYHIAVDIDRGNIFSIAGVHHLPEVDPDSYRCLFRGAQLPGYMPTLCSNLFKNAIKIHFGYFLYVQILDILDINPNAKFFISTNVNSNQGAKSYKMNKTIMPLMEKRGFWSLYKENVVLYNTTQNIYKVNHEFYLEERSKIIPNSLLR